MNDRAPLPPPGNKPYTPPQFDRPGQWPSAGAGPQYTQFTVFLFGFVIGQLVGGVAVLYGVWVARSAG